MNTRQAKISMSAMAVALLFTSASAVAQSTAPTNEPTAGEIVVTANKREQKLNDVGLTVAVLSGQNLRNQQINSLADVANATPSLSFANTATGTPVYTLRGVGFYEQSIGSYPAVSVYIDEVPLPFPVLTAHSTFDLDRLEILKGPQGTLFGQNATGGAINYIAAKPLNHFAAGGSVSYGRFNDIVGDAFVTGPVAPNLNVRLAGRIEHADGWQQSNTRPGDSNGKVEAYMGRLSVAFKPTSGLRFLLNVTGSKDKSDTQAPQTIAYNVQNPIVSPNLLATTLSPQTPRAADWTPGYTFGDARQWQVSLRTELDVTEGVTLTSISSYINYKQAKANDGDGFPISTYDTKLDQGRIKSFTQELRLSNNHADRARWVAGANYEHSNADQKVDLVYPDSSSGTTLGAAFGYPIGQSYFYNYQVFENYAFFGNLEYDIVPKVTLKGGVRYTNSKDSVHACHADASGLPNGTGAFFYNILLGGAFGPYVTGDCFEINDQPQAIGGVAPGAPGEFVDKLDEHNVSWRAGIDWKPSHGILLYANAAKGYKAGSFPTAASSAFLSYLPVTQESVMSYEGGFKASVLNRTLQINGAGFYYDYKNKQLRSKELLLPFGNLDVLQNIPKSTIKGFELEFQAHPIPGFTVNTAFTYIDAKIDQFSGTNAAGVVANFAGTDIPFTPKYQVATSVDYEFAVSDKMKAFAGVSSNFRSDTISIVGGAQNPPTASTSPSSLVPPHEDLFGIGSYVLVDLRAGVKSADDRWQFTVWGKNVFNEYYWNNVVAVFDTVSRYNGKPATYGATFSFRY